MLSRNELFYNILYIKLYNVIFIRYYCIDLNKTNMYDYLNIIEKILEIICYKIISVIFLIPQLNK